MKTAHASIDAAVLAAYGFSGKRPILEQLLALNQDVAKQLSTGKPVTAPGIPPGYKQKQKLVTDDCLGASSESVGE